ncbi:MAG TPA: molybdopterin oxidoreductase family protein [Methylocella sp.]|nr:molybdopterin oxidoreductase family protein [Methylocella sp.]
MNVPVLTKHEAATHCPFCALQCGMILVQNGSHVSVAARDFPTNKGGLCRKGWAAAELLTADGRLRTPLIRERKGGELRAARWDEALDRIVAEFKAVAKTHGADAVGVFGGGGLTNEKAYLLGKFARVALGTANIDYNGRFCMASAAAAGLRAFGLDRGLPFPIEDIPGAGAILLAGANPAETMPPIMQYFEEQRRRGGQLIVADPRRTPTAEAATLHLQLAPGSDAALYNGLLHIAVKDSLIDPQFIADRTAGFEPVRLAVAAYWPDRVERITGVPELQLRQAAHILGEAATAMFLTARGPEQQSHGVDNVLAVINLALALGKAGKPFSGYGCLTGQGNGQGGREHGLKADQLPGYRRIDNPVHRAEIAAIWGVPPQSLPGPGLSACELLDALGQDGGIRALLIMGSNVLVSAPQSAHIHNRIGSLDLLAVADSFLSETAALADVVLPVAQWAEEEGTVTNLEGRILLRRQAVPRPPGVWTDIEIIKGLADRLGHAEQFSDVPEMIFEELRRASAGGAADYAGVTYKRILAEDGIFWPCTSEHQSGTPRLFLDRFATRDGRAKFHAVKYAAPAEEPDQDYPFYLTTGRLLVHYQSGAQTRRISALNEAEPEPFVEVHPDTARSVGIGEGGKIRLVTRRGSAELGARLDPSLRRDTVFVPFHWGGAGCANLLTNPALDPISKMPEFKVCAVRLEPPTRLDASQPSEKKIWT